MTAGVAMTNHGMKEEYVQANIYAWRDTRRQSAAARRLQRKLTLS
jgi:hypothetical protein